MLKLHETYEQHKEKHLVKNYDLLLLKYTQNDSYLAVDAQKGRLIIKEMKNKDQLPLDAVWQLQRVVTGKLDQE